MSIYDRLGQVKSVAEYDAEAQALKGNKLQNMLHQAQYDEYGRKLADDNALRQVVGGFGADDNANVQSLFRAGRLNEAQAYRKSITDAEETRAKTANQNSQATGHALEQKIKAHDFHLQQLGSLTDPSQIDAWAAQGVRDRVLGMQESMAGAAQMKAYAAQNGFEAAKAVAMKAGMNAKDQLAADLAREKFGEDKRQFGVTSTETASNNKAHQAIGFGNLAVAKAREGREARAPKGVYDSERGIMVDPRSGVSVPVTAAGAPIGPKGGPGAKISSEVQRQIGGVVSFDKDLSALEEALKEFNPRNPLDQADTTKRARLASLAKQAQLSAKEAAALGALSGPDMELLEGILNDPTSWKGVVSGSGGIAAQIAEARAGNKRRVTSLQEQYGDKATAGLNVGKPGTASAGGLPSADLIAAELARRGH